MNSLKWRFIMRVGTVSLASLLQAAWTMLFARAVGAHGFGVFGTLVAIGSVIGTVAGAGLGPFALRMTSRDQSSKRAITTMFIMRLGTGAITSLCLVAFGLITGIPLSIVVLIAITSVTVELVSDLSQGVLSGQRRVFYAGGLLVVQRGTVLISLLVGMAAHNATLGVAIGLFIAIVVAVSPAVHYLARPLSPGAILIDARGYWASSVVTQISQFETPVVSAVGGLATAGLYASATRVVSPASIVTNAILNIVAPELAAAQTPEDRRRLFHAARRVSIIVAAIGTVLAVPVGYIGEWLLGHSFTGVALVIAGFVIAAALSGVSRTYQALFYAAGIARSVAVVVFIGAIIGLASLPVLIITFGPFSLGAGPVIAQVVMLAGLVIAERRLLPMTAVRSADIAERESSTEA